MVQSKKELILACCSTAFLAGVIVLLLLYGNSRKIYADRLMVREIDALHESLQVWEKAGVKGRILFLFDRQLNATPLFDALEKLPPASPDNYIYLSFRKNFVRKVYHIIPETSWKEVSANLQRDWAAGETKGYYRVTVDGTPILVMRLSDVPHLKEKVLIAVNADYWNKDDLHGIEALLKRRVITSDIITVSGNAAHRFKEEFLPNDEYRE